MIGNILIIQPIFAPDQVQTQRNIDSIHSLGTYLKTHGTNGINVMLTMGGWAKDDSLWESVAFAGRQEFGDKFSPTRFDRNYGKACVINTLYKNVLNQNPNIQSIISMDSDIIFPLDCKNIFTRLSVAAEKLTESKKMKWGMIALNQRGAGCHWQNCYENQAEYVVSIKGETYKEKMVWPTATSGIAGGCLFINREMFDAVGGYRQMGVYAGDDAYLLCDCARTGYSYQMSDTIYIIHPPENDKKYAEWKVKTCQQDTLSGIKSDITNQVNDAENFWKNR